MKNKKSKRSRASSLLLTIVLIISICVAAYAGYNLYTILSAYHKTDKEYESLQEQYTKVSEESETSVEDIEYIQSIRPEAINESLVEDAPVPIDVDWDSLKAINPDIVGWLYVEAIPQISYPICKGTDNAFYLHHTFEKQSLFSGSIFENFDNSPYFSDPNTVVYGHNMKNQSMFGRLKFLTEKDTFAKSQFFWILTPDGNYRYHIFSVKNTKYNSEVYTLFGGPGPEFVEWENKQKKESVHEVDIPFAETDKVVTLSTCTSNGDVRLVVIGKCVSSIVPVEKDKVLD